MLIFLFNKVKKNEITSAPLEFVKMEKKFSNQSQCLDLGKLISLVLESRFAGYTLNAMTSQDNIKFICFFHKRKSENSFARRQNSVDVSSVT